jgi:glycerophosphoryl diester phosphodiesterase
MIKIMAHRTISKRITSNSIDNLNDFLKNDIDIIELDVRKSIEGKLYCFHGNFFEYILLKF